jgi:hypothetical protein
VLLEQKKELWLFWYGEPNDSHVVVGNDLMGNNISNDRIPNFTYLCIFVFILDAREQKMSKARGRAG